MPPTSGQPTVLLVENDPDLRELEELILSDAGFRVETPPVGIAPVTYAQQTCPQVIVVHLAPRVGAELDLIDQLQANPLTRMIPVVAIAGAESLAARAQAG